MGPFSLSATPFCLLFSLSFVVKKRCVNFIYSLDINLKYRYCCSGYFDSSAIRCANLELIYSSRTLSQKFPRTVEQKQHKRENSSLNRMKRPNRRATRVMRWWHPEEVSGRRDNLIRIPYHGESAKMNDDSPGTRPIMAPRFEAKKGRSKVVSGAVATDIQANGPATTATSTAGHGTTVHPNISGYRQERASSYK